VKHIRSQGRGFQFLEELMKSVSKRYFKNACWRANNNPARTEFSSKMHPGEY
jgi:hypothetical protein